MNILLRSRRPHSCSFIRFRGRELAHGQLGMQVLQRVQEDMTETAKVEQYPRMEGRQMLMVLAPK